MKNYFYYLFISLIFLLVNDISAQCTVKKYSRGQNILLGVPEILNTYVRDNNLQKFTRFGEDDLSSFVGRDFNQCKPWEVFSIRNNNKIYKNPTNDITAEVVGYANFRDKFYVEELSGNLIKVKRKLNKPAIGWMHAEDLIISKFAPINKTGSTKKAIAIRSISGLLDMSEEERLDALNKEKYYFDDNLELAQNNGPDKFEILFVYKVQGKNLLLGNSDELKNEDFLRGWVHESQVQPWDKRVCFEISDERAAYKAYKDKTLHVFAEYNSLTEFRRKDWVKPSYGIMRDVKLKGKRDYASTMRMPIIPKNEFLRQDEHKIATFAGLRTEDGGILINDTDDIEKKYYETLRKIKSWQKKRSNIKIIFLVDASGTMSRYKDKIKNIVEKLDKIEVDKEEAGKKLTDIRIGLVVYRGLNETGKFKSIEHYPFNASPFDAIKSSISRLEFGSNEDDYSENVFGGFDKALSMFDNESTNILIHVGDCGNYLNDVDALINRMDGIGKSFFEKSINYIGIQTRNSTKDQSYGNFILQVQHIIDKQFEYQTAKITGDPDPNEIKKDIVSNNRRAIWSTKNPGWYPLVTSFSYKYSAYELKDDEFFREMDYGLTNAIDKTEKYIKKLEILLNKYSGGGNGTTTPQVTFDDQMIQFLKSQGMTQESIDLLTSKGEICGEGYVQTKYYDEDIEYLKKVIYMSVSWKENILDPAFDKFSDLEVTDLELRKNLKDAFVQLAKAFYGKDEPANVIENMTIGSVWKDAIGIKFVGDNRLSALKIAQIESENSLLESDVRKFATKLKSEIKNKWHQIKYDPYTLFEKGIGSNRTQFLWVPIEYFPYSE